MPKIVFVTGLPGSGKSHYLDRLGREGFERFDDFKSGAVDNSPAFKASSRFAALVVALRKGGNCAVGDIDFCRATARAEADTVIRLEVPTAEVEWRCFENDPRQCRANILSRCRPSVDRDLLKLDEFAVSYSTPDGCLVLPVWRPQS